jgi:serine/threonine-protein kinase
MTNPPPDRPPVTGPVLLQSGRTTYELIRPLEQTVHGELLLARRHFGTNMGDYVILKRLSRECREEDLRRLMEEVAVTVRLRHPGIAGMHLVEGTVDDPYLVLEYVEGHRLDTLLECVAQGGKPLSEAFACYVGMEVAAALHHAHELTNEAGRWLRLVHRNVSPHTIMVGTGGEVKLTDLGSLWAALPGRQPTEDDALPGNLAYAYASPELTRKGTIDRRTDQFSLAAVLLHLLSGRPLIEGSDRVTQELRELRRRVDEALTMGPADPAAVALIQELRGQIHKRTTEFVDRIRSLSTREVTDATSELPAGLRPILRRALAPRRADRYPTCGEFGEQLRLHLFRLGQLYGKPEAEREVANLVRAASGSRSKGGAAARTPRGGPAKARRTGTSAEGRRKREAPRR